ncbi:MAG: Sec-independent protein translocase protein TatB [Burkholderiales bacterium]|jgi:sec-independent protein translocase protein TatB|nr:Sec-independent protein translocase protein TatB [Burkholderiales bacterium]
MFDVGFSEMIVIGIVALVVIGPERLPKVARTVGHLIGRAQRYVSDVKRDIDREVQIDELRKLQSQMQDAAREIETSVSSSVAEVKQELDKTEGELTAVADSLNSGDTVATAETVTGPVALSDAAPVLSNDESRPATSTSVPTQPTQV